MGQMRERIRYLHYSHRTEQAYLFWVRRYLRFHDMRHPTTMGRTEVEAFLSSLVNEGNVAASTHRQALAALLFLYSKVLQTDLPWMSALGRPKVPAKLPVVMSRDDVAAVLQATDPPL